jgi:hypothetical protein
MCWMTRFAVRDVEIARRADEDEARRLKPVPGIGRHSSYDERVPRFWG